MTVRDIDRGYRALLRRLEESATISVGVQGTKASAAHDGSEESVVDIATKHEFGIDVPRRSFIRDWFDEQESDNRRLINRLGDAVARGRSDVGQAAETFGLLTVGAIQERISGGIAPPNSPATEERKGSSTPLIDTGQLRSSITHTVDVRSGRG